MSDWREERAGETGKRWESGPLGDESGEETRRIPRPEPREPEPERTEPERGEAVRRSRREPSGPLNWDEEPETRAGRPSRSRQSRNRTSRNRETRERGGTREWSYPPQSFEAVGERGTDEWSTGDREDRLRELYGGVDWLASFVGFVFTAVTGTAMFFAGGLALLAPLQFPLALQAGDFGTAVYTGLAVVAVILFLGYFFGGYVSGRLARFDGGRNGTMVVLWTFILLALILVAGGVLSSFLSSPFLDDLRTRILGINEVATSSLAQLGTIGAAIAVGGLLIVVLGAFLGGRLGESYHTNIDRTT